MAYNFDRDKYKKTFESMYGSGAYARGLSSAREIGRSKAAADYAKQAYQEALKQKKKELENKTYTDAITEFGTTPDTSTTGISSRLNDIIKNPRKNGASRNEEEIRNDPALQQEIKALGYSVDEFINAMYHSATDGEMRSSREYKQYAKQTAKDAKNKPKAWEVQAKQATTPKKEEKKDDGNLFGNFINKIKKSTVGRAAKATGQALNPFDDVSMKEAVDEFINAPQSKTFQEVARGANRAVDSASLGALSNLDKRVNDRDPYYNSQRKVGEGGLTDILTSTAGYLVPGVGAYKLLDATKAGKALSQLGAKGIKQRLGTEAAKGAITGAGVAGVEVANREVLNPDDYTAGDNLKHLAIGTAAGAIADPALYGAGKLIGRGFENATNRVMENLVPSREETARQIYDVVNSLRKSSDEVLGLPAPQQQLPAPSIPAKPSLEPLTKLRGLESPIPDMPDILRQQLNRARLEGQGLNFGQGSRYEPKPRVRYEQSPQNQAYWQGRYEEFADYVNKNYDMNQMVPEALEDLWTQFAKYDEPVRLEEVIDLAYPQGYEPPARVEPVQELTPVPVEEPRLAPVAQEPTQPISRVATPEEIIQQMEEAVAANPRNVQPELQPLQFKRSIPAEGLQGQGDLALLRENINPGTSSSEPSLNRLASLKKGVDYEPIEQPKYGDKLIRLKDGEMPRGEALPPAKVDNPKELVKKQISMEWTKEKKKWSFDKFYTAWIDDLRPLNKATKELGGKDLSFGDNPYNQARLARGVAGKAETYLRGGVFDESGQKVGKSLEEILKPIEDKFDDFLAYATSKRALDYDEKGLQAGIKPKDVEGLTDGQLADAAIKQLETESPEFQAAHQELIQYSNRLMDELVDAGVLDEMTVLSLREENPNYIPMFRVQEPRVRGFEPLSNPKQKYANLGEAFKKRTGSEKEIINPVESIIKNTYLTLNMAERNRVGRSLLDLIEQSGDNTWGRLLKADNGLSVDEVSSVLDDAGKQIVDGDAPALDNLFKGEGNKVYVYRDGQRVEVELQEDLYKAMLSLDTQKQNFFIQMLSVPTRMLRTGAVLSPDFGPVNIFRDQFSAFVNSKYGFVPFVDMFKGLGNVLKKDSTYWQWKNNGGANSVLSNLDREYLQKDLRTMVKQSLPQKLKNNFGSPKKALDTALEPLRKVSEITEEATRVGEFKKGLKKGATPREAAFASRDLIDFNRAGNLGRQYNQITAFFNAAVQSTDKLARTFKENPVKASTNALIGITLPSVGFYFMNQDKDWYKEIPQRDRDLYWHFEAGDQIIKLPKPFEAGILFGTTVERFLDYLKTDDPEAFDELGKTVAGAFTPSWVPTAVSPWIEVFANKSMYFDSPIVPRREQDLLAEDQYGPYQSELAKGLGSVMKQSPRNIEHVFKGYTGGLGRYGLQIADKGYQTATGKDQPELPDKGIAEVPIVNRFVVKNLEGTNQSVNDFYDNMDKLRRENLSAKRNETASPSADAYKAMNQLSREISELQAEKRKIIEDPNLSGEEKAEIIKIIDQNITQIAKYANTIE